MPKKTTASGLRQNIYQILDNVIATGEPVEVIRNGVTLRITVENPPSKLSRLKKRTGVLIGDPERIVHMDWLSEWTELDAEK